MVSIFIIFILFLIFPFILSFSFQQCFSLPQFIHSRYGRVQSVKIITATTSGTVPSITSTTESQTGEYNLSSSTQQQQQQQHSSSVSGKCHQTNSNSNNNTFSNSNSNNNVIGNTSQPIVGSNSLHNNNNNPLEQSNGTSSNLSSNVSSSNQSSTLHCGMPTIGICATIAFMDIKSASKAHLAEHKFDDRILTTEYYEPSTMQQHVGDGSIVINNSKMNDCTGDMKQQDTTTVLHGRYTSTSSHGLVLLDHIFSPQKILLSMTLASQKWNGQEQRQQDDDFFIV